MSTAALLRSPSARVVMPMPLEVKRTAEISPCGTYRWWLRRDFGAYGAAPGPILPWIMLNPSTADSLVDDPTLRRIFAFSWRWGFNGILVLNLFPFRSPQPRDLARWVRWDERQDWGARDALQSNWSRAALLLAPFDAAMVAWGSAAGPLARDVTVAAESFFDAVNDPDGPRTSSLDHLFCLGKTGAGDPIHPMARGRHRVPDEVRPRPYGRSLGTVRFGAATAVEAPPGRAPAPNARRSAA